MKAKKKKGKIMPFQTKVEVLQCQHTYPTRNGKASSYDMTKMKIYTKNSSKIKKKVNVQELFSIFLYFYILKDNCQKQKY